MRDHALLGASALVLVLGIAAASAQPSGQAFLTRGDVGAVQTYAPTLHEGRAAAIDAPEFHAPAFATSGFNLEHRAGR